jgi:hypothetical protein
MTTADQGKDSPLRSDLPARQTVSRLIRAASSERSGNDSPARSAAGACDQLYRELSRWVGPDGCHALFTRALAEARTEYPASQQIQLNARSDPYVDGVAETIMARGDPATAESIQSMLVRVIELLGRLIGDDMATKLIERSLASSEKGGAASENRQEEA